MCQIIRDNYLITCSFFLCLNSGSSTMWHGVYKVLESLHRDIYPGIFRGYLYLSLCVCVFWGGGCKKFAACFIHAQWELIRQIQKPVKYLESLVLVSCSPLMMRNCIIFLEQTLITRKCSEHKAVQIVCNKSSVFHLCQDRLQFH